MGFEATLWRSIAVYRAAALLYAGVLIGLHHPEYAHPLGGWLVFGAMTAWTAFAVYAYRDPGRRGWPLLSADLAVAVGCLLATGWAESLGRLMLGAPNLPASWVASPVLAWAVAKGRRSGAIAAGLVALADFLLPRGRRAARYHAVHPRPHPGSRRYGHHLVGARAGHGDRDDYPHRIPSGDR